MSETFDLSIARYMNRRSYGTVFLTFERPAVELLLGFFRATQPLPTAKARLKRPLLLAPAHRDYKNVAFALVEDDVRGLALQMKYHRATGELAYATMEFARPYLGPLWDPEHGVHGGEFTAKTTGRFFDTEGVAYIYNALGEDMRPILRTPKT